MFQEQSSGASEVWGAEQDLGVWVRLGRETLISFSFKQRNLIWTASKTFFKKNGLEILKTAWSAS